jgi:hypothetical protein
MNTNPYSLNPVLTITTIGHVKNPDYNPSKHRLWELGRLDRIQGRPCQYAKGPYLDGFYSV